MNVGKETRCPICKKKFIEHSELQDKICKMITIKQFANISPGFDVQHRPFFEDWNIYSSSILVCNCFFNNYTKLFNTKLIPCVSSSILNENKVRKIKVNETNKKVNTNLEII